ncbi:hypothetical protein VTI74DRAFT_5910 [Chaetomium olivicolor]
MLSDVTIPGAGRTNVVPSIWPKDVSDEHVQRQPSDRMQAAGRPANQEPSPDPAFGCIHANALMPPISGAPTALHAANSERNVLDHGRELKPQHKRYAAEADAGN